MTQVRTVNIKGKQYIDVAERVRLCNADEGFSMLKEEALEIAGTHTLRVYIEVKGKQYIGDAEIKVDAKPGTADGDSPISCAQTSALGRALGFAGYGSLESIASADEVARNEQPSKDEGVLNECKRMAKDKRIATNGAEWLRYLEETFKAETSDADLLASPVKLASLRGELLRAKAVVS